MKTYIVLLLAAGTLVGPSSFAAPLLCKSLKQPLGSRSRLFKPVDQATETADFGSRYLRKSSEIKKLTLQTQCFNRTETLERLTLTYFVRAHATLGPFEGTFFCTAKAQRTLLRNNVWSYWTIAQPICGDARSRGGNPGNGDTGGNSGNDDTGSPDEVPGDPSRGAGNGGPDEIDDGSGSRGDTGEGSGNPGGSDSDF